MVIAGGDHPVSMPHPGDYAGTGSEVVAVNNLTGKWRIVRPFCVPNEVQPARPDNVVWLYDSKRDRGIMTPGYYGVDWVGGGCGEIIPAQGRGYGAFALDFASGKWTGPDDVVGIPAPPDMNWGGDRGANWGVYSKVTDELLRLRQDGGQRLEALNLATKKWRFLPLGNSAQPARTQLVIDDADPTGPKIYWLDLWQNITQPDGVKQVQNPPYYLTKMDIRTGAITRARLPSQFKGQEGLADDIYLAFDTINRLVFVPNNYDMGGAALQGLGIYHVDTGQWEWENVPSTVVGSAWGFDESVGALIGVGKRNPPYGTFLYKYK
jgi:hypothetical protein